VAATVLCEVNTGSVHHCQGGGNVTIVAVCGNASGGLICRSESLEPGQQSSSTSWLVTFGGERWSQTAVARSLMQMVYTTCSKTTSNNGITAARQEDSADYCTTTRRGHRACFVTFDLDVSLAHTRFPGQHRRRQTSSTRMLKRRAFSLSPRSPFTTLSNSMSALMSHLSSCERYQAMRIVHPGWCICLPAGPQRWCQSA
jgi:hypothetical protein